MIDKSHPRYEEIDKFKFVFFNKHEKLREHIIKHIVLNVMEYEGFWKSFLSLKANYIQKLKKKLDEIDCKSINVPHCASCGSFKRCTPIIEELEQKYCDGIRHIIEDGISRPRYATFKDNNDCNKLWILPDSLVAFKSVRHNKIYNVTTCYKPLSLYSNNLCNFINDESDKIKEEAKHRTIVWEDEKTWKILKKGKKKGYDKKTKKKKKLKPYSRSQKRNVRDYLDQL